MAWDVASGALLLRRPLGPHDPQFMRLAPDGARLALGSISTGLTLIETGGDHVALELPVALARRIAFDGSGERLVVETREDGGAFRLSLFSVAGESLGRVWQHDGCASLAFDATGARLAVGSEQRMIRILDGNTLEERATLLGHAGQVGALAFAPGGAHLASASTDGTVRVWSLDGKGRCLRVLPGGGASSLAFSTDGNLLAIGSSVAARLRSWRDVGPLVLRGHERYVYAVAFSPDGTLIASSAWDDTIRLWDGIDGEPLAVMPAKFARIGVGFTRDGSMLVTPTSHDDEPGGRLDLFDLGTGRLLSGERASAERRRLVDQAGGRYIEFARAVTGGARCNIDGAVPEAATNADGRLFAQALRSGEIQIREVDSGVEIHRLGGPGRPVESLAFSPDDKRLVSGHSDGTIRVWSLESGAELAALVAHDSNVYAAVFSPDGTRLATGGNDGTIILRDAASLAELAVLRGHESYVFCLAFSPDGTRLVSGSGDGTLRLWDTVPWAERHEQLRVERAHRAQLAPQVRRLLDELDEASAVAERLRDDATLTPAERRAALRVLLGTGAGGVR